MRNPTIQEVLNELQSPVDKVEKTVDTLKYGSQTTEVSGIAVSFMPTYTVIKKAIELGANLLITHEGLFFSHWDQNELGDNKVIDDKISLIESSGIAIYRFHDYYHRYKPDGIMVGLVKELNWEPYVEEHLPTATVVNIPNMTVKEIAEYIQTKLGISFLRYVGNSKMTCSRIGLLAGYRGSGLNAIPLFDSKDLDLIIYGEGPEWETPEYVRDAISLGKEKSLLILGHAESEEPGMKYLATILTSLYPNTPVHFILNEQNINVI